MSERVRRHLDAKPALHFATLGDPGAVRVSTWAAGDARRLTGRPLHFWQATNR